MTIVSVDLIIVAILLAAAGWALWLAWITARVGSWGTLGAGLALMGMWHLSRGIHQYAGSAGDGVGPSFTLLGTSILLFVGIVVLTPAARGSARAAEKMRASAQRYQRIVDTTIDGIVVTDLNGTIESFNPAAEKIFGYSAQEAVGKNVSFLVPEDQAESFGHHLEHYRRADQDHGIGMRREVRARHKEGREFPVAIAINQMGMGHDAGFVATIHDISKMLWVEDRLAESNRLLQTVLDTIPVAVYWKDTAGSYLGGNSVFARDAGVDAPEKFIGMTDADMPWADHAGPVARIERSIIQSGEARLGLEEPRSDIDGRDRWLHTSRVPLRDKSGDIIGVLGLYEDITDEFQFREALLLEKQRVDRYLDVSGAMIVEIDAQGRVELINRKGLEILGCRQADLVGRDWFDTVVPQDQRERMRDTFIRTMSRDAKPYTAVEGEVITQSGEHRLIAWQVSYDMTIGGQITKVVGSGVDVTDMRRTDRMLRVAVESLNDGFALFDSEDRLVLFNTVYTQFFPIAGAIMRHGRTYEEIIRYGAENGQFGDLGDGVEAFIQEQLAMHRNPTCSRELQTVEGRWIRVDERRTEDGGVVGTRTDITDLKRATEDAEQANSAKSQFLSSMSHELRTPLNAIMGFAQILEDDPEHPLADSQKEEVAQIIHSAEHLMGLVGEVLDLTRIETGKLHVEPKAVSIQTVLSQVYSLVRPLADQAGVVLENGIDVIEGQVWADEVRLRQVLINLMSNAIKYNVAGGRVSVTFSSLDNGYRRLTVADTGRGIPEDRQDQVFDPFNRMGAEKSAIEGTGIGLTITKHLVELMGGKIGFSSGTGKGTAFWVDLLVPQSRVPAEEEKTVLYLDESRINHQFMQVALKGVGHLNVIAAGSLADGIDLSAETAPDVVIFDRALGGVEVVETLRKVPVLKNVPLIGVGDDTHQDADGGACDDGCDMCLTRPLRQSDLRVAFDTVLGRAGGITP